MRPACPRPSPCRPIARRAGASGRAACWRRPRAGPGSRRAVGERDNRAVPIPGPDARRLGGRTGWATASSRCGRGR